MVLNAAFLAATEHGFRDMVSLLSTYRDRFASPTIQHHLYAYRTNALLRKSRRRPQIFFRNKAVSVAFQQVETDLSPLASEATQNQVSEAIRKIKMRILL
jgi:hypothetical protein